MIPLASTADPSTLISSGVSWFLGIAATLFGAFIAYHAIKNLVSHRERGLMPFIELAVVGILAAVFIFRPQALAALGNGVAQAIGLPTG